MPSIALLLALLHQPDPPVASVPPNIVVVLVDDLGLDQLACYDDVNRYTCNYPYAYTPYIDMLAAAGVRFTQARATPLCSPTRAALQSGMYGRRTGCGNLVTSANASTSFREFGVAPAPQPACLADLAHGFGYATGMFGKLHLHLDDCTGEDGSGDTYAVDHLGYDVFRGIARNSYSPPTPETLSGTPHREVSFTYYYWLDTSAVPVRQVECGCAGGCAPPTLPCDSTGQSFCSCTEAAECHFGRYLTTKQGEAVGDWIAGVQEPYFALWCLNDIHSPPQWPPDVVDGREMHHFGPTPPDDGTAGTVRYNTRTRAKLEYVDSELGRLLSQIDLQNTLVILLGDNGTQDAMADIFDDELPYPSDHPLRSSFTYPPGCEPAQTGHFYSMDPYVPARMKGTPYEAGVRVPLLVAGAGIVNPGRSSAALVDVVDVLETMNDVIQTALTGSYVVPSPTNDGKSFGCVLRAQCNASQHARQFSYAGLFAPNTFPVPIQVSTAKEYYIRRDSFGNLWKIVRSGGLPATDEFYNLRTDPLETDPLPKTSIAYQQTSQAFGSFLASFP